MSMSPVLVLGIAHSLKTTAVASGSAKTARRSVSVAGVGASIVTAG